MKLRYGSEEAQGVIEKIYKTIRDSAENQRITKEKGVFRTLTGKYLQGWFIKKLQAKSAKKSRKTN